LKCLDIVALPPNGEPRPCACGKSRARYIDGNIAHYSGPARLLGIGNRSVYLSLHNESREGPDGMAHPRYDWWVIPEGRNIKKVKRV
jgi:hypothetical protein